ncbi:hypothetical protein HPB52_020398 [Rhipicephalus sanguineus]|uniref:Uncharacterized protein n=1 Tax=Rhipicephalus sanguineus TaxID=34632 RepID=A0A9D4PNA1_RHISA|nr:hypothetical protein HPB52_020398 [Rhipicephalus sanguineus]
MLLVPGILVLLAACAQSEREPDQLPLGIKSMLLIGGDMGDIYPGDSQNLTAYYPNLYLVDRVGYCELEIAVPDGEKLLHTVAFNTTVPRAGSSAPPFLRDFFTPAELKTCRSPDMDPTRSCQPVLCDIKYSGVRNFFNETSQRCEPTANCWDNAEEEMVYLAGSNTCRRVGEVLSEEELDYFDSFQDKKSPLRSMHGYPIKVNCHKGRPDPGNGWCLCDPGWESDPLEHQGFNPDLMVYHMCTVYVGITTAATGNSSSPAHRHRHRKKGHIAYIPKKRRRGELERGAKLMLRGKSGVTGGTADSPADDDAASGDAGADGGGPSWYSSYVSDAQMKNVVLPMMNDPQALIVVVALLSCLVITLCGVVAFECHKVNVVSTDSAL